MYGTMSNKPKPKYPHKMYKGKIVKIVTTEAEHNKLMSQGYNHTKPKTKKAKAK
jgi:hypothetical protein